ncbi:MAG: hypothetical protein ABFD62_09050 [Syntrophaceae bacterium]
MRKLLALLLLLMLTGCTALNYSQTFIPDYKAKTIAVFPVDSGVHKDSAAVMDKIVADELADKGWYSKVFTAKDLKACIDAGAGTKKDYSDYMAKLTMVNYSDRELSSRIGAACGADAFLLATVDQWTYIVEGPDKDKFARVGLSFRMIDAATGKDVWRAAHTETEKYLLLKPELSGVARKLAGKMLSRMPH